MYMWDMMTKWGKIIPKAVLFHDDNRDAFINDCLANGFTAFNGREAEKMWVEFINSNVYRIYCETVEKKIDYLDGEYRIDASSIRVYQNGKCVYTPSPCDISRGEFERFRDAIQFIEMVKQQPLTAVDVETPIGILNTTKVSNAFFNEEKWVKYPHYIGTSKAFLVENKVYYEEYTCYSGYDGTCRCISHPRRKWREYTILNSAENT